MFFIYNILIYFLAFLFLPKIIYQYFRYGKYRDSLSRRMGFHFPEIEKKGRQLVWIHAGSLGETKAIAALAKKIKAEKNPILLISSITETGHQEAKKGIPFADYHLYLPFDFPITMRAVIAKATPDLVILSESDFWLNFLRFSKENGAKIVVVNGKISERSAARFKKFAKFSSLLFGLIDHLCIQNSEYQQRFASIGIPENKMSITGNLKFDEVYTQMTQEQKQEMKQQLGIQEGDPVLVVGSSHDPEERLILEALGPVWQKFPALKVCFVPRHPERFSEVESLVSKMQMPYHKLSQTPKNDSKVILIDKMGILRTCYQLADIAIVGGSYTDRVGGHNIIEPSGYGVPVLFGPHMHTQSEMVAVVKKYHAGEQLPIEQLSDRLIELLANPEERQKLGQGGITLLQAMRGATEKTWQQIEAIWK